MSASVAATSQKVREINLAKPEIVITKRPDGSILAEPAKKLGPYPASMTHALEKWARETPDAIFLAQRDATGAWQRVTYASAHAAARAIGAALLSRGLSPEWPLVILSGNDIGHALMGLGAQMAGIPYAPISPAYGTLSDDFGKLRHIFDLLTPGLVYVSNPQPFQRAIERVVPKALEIVTAGPKLDGRRSTTLHDLIMTPNAAAIDAAHAKVGPDTIAKFLFTSGSTGLPKAVINTQRMLASNQAMFAAHAPFIHEEPQVLVDWLPWSHTFGGNHNFNLVLTTGGTFYIDDGRPMPGAIAATAKNLKEIAPTIYFNVPRGFEALLPMMQADDALAKNFLSRFKAMIYAGASLPQHVWDGLIDLSIKTTGERVRFLTGLGSTETAPGAITANALSERAGMVGLPMPGCDLKLVPNGGKLELRMRGPNIMPGYWKNEAQTKSAFDEEGFYKIGDALKFVDEAAPERGFLFDGRVAEDFKLVTGTWVSVGPLRSDLTKAFAPLIRDAVICGHDKGYISALLIPELEPCRAIAGLAADAPAADVYTHEKVRAAFSEKLAAFAKDSKGSSNRVERAIIFSNALSLDAGEVTDKGSINQRVVIANHASLVDELYADAPSSRSIALAKSV